MTEEIRPKSIRTWAIFKNTNNTLEGIESIAFAMRQVALDEIEKESDNVVFMSDNTVKLIMGTLKRLEQERDELKFENDRYKQLLKGCPTEDEDCGYCVIDEQNKRLKQENKELKEETLQWKQIKDMANNNKYRSTLEKIREIVTSAFAKQRPYKEDFAEIETKINEVLND